MSQLETKRARMQEIHGTIAAGLRVAAIWEKQQKKSTSYICKFINVTTSVYYTYETQKMK